MRDWRTDSEDVGARLSKETLRNVYSAPPRVLAALFETCVGTLNWLNRLGSYALAHWDLTCAACVCSSLFHDCVPEMRAPPTTFGRIIITLRRLPTERHGALTPKSLTAAESSSRYPYRRRTPTGNRGNYRAYLSQKHFSRCLGCTQVLASPMARLAAEASLYADPSNKCMGRRGVSLGTRIDHRSNAAHSRAYSGAAPRTRDPNDGGRTMRRFCLDEGCGTARGNLCRCRFGSDHRREQSDAVR
jgi:hypothetical protein